MVDLNVLKPIVQTTVNTGLRDMETLISRLSEGLLQRSSLRNIEDRAVGLVERLRPVDRNPLAPLPADVITIASKEEQPITAYLPQGSDRSNHYAEIIEPPDSTQGGSRNPEMDILTIKKLAVQVPKDEAPTEKNVFIIYREDHRNPNNNLLESSIFHNLPQNIAQEGSAPSVHRTGFFTTASYSSKTPNEPERVLEVANFSDGSAYAEDELSLHDSRNIPAIMSLSKRFIIPPGTTGEERRWQNL